MKNLERITMEVIRGIVENEDLTKEEKMETLRRIGNLFMNSADDIFFGGDGLMEDI